jgi:SAM-dependent methyltransferase
MFEQLHTDMTMIETMKTSVTAHPYRDFELSGWERAAAAYAQTFESATRLYADALLDAVRLEPGVKLLDIACGTGHLSQLASERGAVVVGADFSAAMLAEARRLHPSIGFAQADAEALPYPDENFDAATISFGIHHFPFPERALAEARRVLRKGGSIAFTVWSTPDEHALHGVALEAVHAAGIPGFALPEPPQGVLNTLERCMGLLEPAGLEPDGSRCGVVRRTLRLGSVADLIYLIESGTVRLASLLRSQPAANRAKILRALEAAAAKYQFEGGLAIPMAAVVTVARRPNGRGEAGAAAEGGIW